MKLRYTVAVLATTAMAPLGVSLAQAATLSDLVAGNTLTESDLVFDNFFFDDRFGVDATGTLPDNNETPFAGDRSVDASEVEITTSSTAGSVSLIAKIDPAISIADEESPGIDHLFEFFLDFNVSVIGGSSRQITAVTLGGGDLFATGTSVAEVIYDIVGFTTIGNDLEIFESPSFSPFSQTSDTQNLTATSFLDLKGQIEGNTRAGDVAGLSTFFLRFDLAGTPPPPPPPPDGVVPVPPALPLFVTALAGLALWRRARHV